MKKVYHCIPDMRMDKPDTSQTKQEAEERKS